MSQGEAPDRVAMAHLEETVGLLLDRVHALRERVEVAEARVGEMDRALRARGGDGSDPSGMADVIRGLRDENDALRARMEKGARVVDRILARLRFLEERA